MYLANKNLNKRKSVIKNHNKNEIFYYNYKIYIRVCNVYLVYKVVKNKFYKNLE